MKRLTIILFCSAFLVITTFSATIKAIHVPTAIADSGGSGIIGYPYSVFVQISGWTKCSNSQAYLKIYNGSNVEYMWSASNSWSNTNQYSVSSPIISIDADGNWTGWIYLKHNTSLGTFGAVRAAKVGSTSTNLTSSAITFEILSMSSTGGWLTAAKSNAANKCIVAYSGTIEVGSYRSEDNGITEGYLINSGGFKIAVPAGRVDSAVFYNDDGSYYSSIVGPWSVTASTETDISSNVSIGSGTASITPSLWKYNSPTALKIFFKSTIDTVQNIRIARPSVFNWSVDNMTLTPNIGNVTTIADTIQIAGLNLKGADSLKISINNVTAMDTTAAISVLIKTSKDTITYKQIATLPQTLIYGSPLPLNSVKAKDGFGVPLLNGKYVVVKGVVTVSDEFGIPAYIQDETAGIAVYDTSVSNNVTEGDEVVLLGVVSPFNGLSELNPCSLLQTISQGNPIDTILLSIEQIKAQPINGVEPYECRLVRVNNITKVVTTTGITATAWTTTGSGTDYELISGTDTLYVRIGTKTNIACTPVPSSKFDVVGALGQYTTNYEILPRSYNDLIIEGAGPRIISIVPYESAITDTSVTFVWQTNVPGSSIVTHGLSTLYTDTLIDTNSVTTHALVVKCLLPATMYHIKLGSANAAGSSYTKDYIVSTASRSSLGTINVYFNHSVNTALARNESAQNVSIVDKIINRIKGAKYSIDAALYSLSGTVGANIATALIDAKERGATVRIIGEYDNCTTAPWTTLSSSCINVIFDNYDAVNAGAGLMHNKFFIIDMQDPVSDTTSWVISGSWNATDPGNTNDAQNIIEIQDKALANAYTAEFNEMWGSSTATPSAANSRFGAHKLDNTPHCFFIKNVPVELYFSPSDGTTSKIIKTLNKAASSIDFGVMTFTRTDIASVLNAKKNAGIKIHGVMDNRTDQGSVFDSLVASGIDVHLKGNAITGLFHHKYSVIDAESFNPDQYVITGSQNWSSSAENSNDENTLIINSQRIANLYLQEFSARYTEAGGTDVTHECHYQKQCSAIKILFI